MENLISKLIEQYGMIALPVGFLSMLIARSGYYKFDDVLRRSLITLMFSAIAYHGHSWISKNITFTSHHWITACIMTLCVALFWRKWGADIYFKIINNLGISNENECGNVLNTLTQNTSFNINGINVYTKNGKFYSCSDLGWVKLNIDKNAYLIIDETGILLPVTYISNSNQSGFTDVSGEGNLIIKNVGTNHTYIPSSEIIRYDFIISKKHNRMLVFLKNTYKKLFFISW